MHHRTPGMEESVKRRTHRISKASTITPSKRTPSTTSKKSKTLQQLHSTKILGILIFGGYFIIHLLYNLHNISSVSNAKDEESFSLPSSSNIPTIKLSIRQQSRDDSSSTVDPVVDFLLSFAQKSTHDIRSSIPEEIPTDNHNHSDQSTVNNDIFDLRSLATKNVCPFTATTLPTWLPPTPDSKASELFKQRHSKQAEQIIPVVWYEHLSKAGGTTFCEIAQSNMPRGEVPPYYCMPSDGKFRDGRVGVWSNDKLKHWIHTHAHRMVSNEWNPFPPERFGYNAQEQQPSQGGSSRSSTSRLLFVTTIRHPLNRLLSAYHFWGVTHGRKQPLSFPKWLQRHHGISKKEPSRSMKVAPHVSRYNYMTWKFSNGTMPLYSSSTLLNVKEEFPPIHNNIQSSITTEVEQDSLKSFEMAIRTLSQFHLVMLTELMSLSAATGPYSLESILGWQNMKDIHVVPSGKVTNNDAKSKLSKDSYDFLWDTHKFDMILYYWQKAVYLTRLHCAHLLSSSRSST